MGDEGEENCFDKIKPRINGFLEYFHVKKTAQQVGLLVILTLYTIGGGFIFKELEYPSEIAKINDLRETINKQRQTLIYKMVNDIRNYSLLQDEVRNYEKLLKNAFEVGVAIHPEDQTIKWTVNKAVFFSTTILTTIGYGNIAPETTNGRMFCMVYALIGIPLTLTVIADWGKIFASGVTILLKKTPPLPDFIRTALETRKTSSYSFIALMFLLLYMSIGALLLTLWEKQWSFFEGFYFCFITMTTIGFGDLVPNHLLGPVYIFICLMYILVGLAFTSTIIELVRRQYAQSWKQIRTLHGPLAYHLRRIADNAPGLDVLTFQQDFMKVFTTVSVPNFAKAQSGYKKKSTRDSMDWDSAVEATIRDMMYKFSHQNPQEPVRKKRVIKFVITRVKYEL